MKFILFLCCSLLPFISLIGQEQITVFGTRGQWKPEQFALKVNQFEMDRLSNSSDETTLRICESIDNSNLVIIGPQFPVAGLKSVFDQTPVCNSLRHFLERGGILLFCNTTWDIITHFPPSLTQFFKSVGAALITPANYQTLKSPEGKEVYMKGKPVPDYPGKWLRTPNANYETASIRHFGDLAGTRFKVLCRDNRNNALIICEEDICGKGTVIFSHAYDLLRKTEHPFMTNLLGKAYGERRKVSSREILRAKLPPAAAPAAKYDGKLIELSEKPQVLTLENLLHPDKPFKKTQVEVSLRDDTLYVKYICAEPNPAALRSAVTVRDAQVWQDDCVELMIAPDARHGSPFYHFIVNSRGIAYDAKNGNSAWNPDYRVHTALKDQNWEVDLSIPLKELGITGPSFRVNFGREEKQNNELTSWVKTKQFTNPSAMGWATTVPRDQFPASQNNPASRSGGKITVWQLPLFTKIYNDTFPPENRPDTTAVNLLIARNEKESTSLLISNTTDENLYFRVEPQFFLNDGKTIFSEMFTIKETIPWRSTTGQVFSEALTGLNQGNILTVPALETRQLWIDAKTDLPAGDYRWSLALIPVNLDQPTRKIDFNVKVLSLRFPDKLPIRVYTFGPYGFSWAHNEILRENYWRTCLDYHINTVQSVEGPRDAIQQGTIISDRRENYIAQEPLLKKLNADWVYGYGIYPYFKRQMEKQGKAAPIHTSPEMRQLFRQWMTNWVRFLKEENVDFKCFLIPLQDEPRGSDIDELLAAAQIIHEVDPSLRTTATIATWSTPEELKKLNPAIDVWIPWEPRLTTQSNAAAELAFYRSTGKPFYPYLCSTSGNTSPYLNYFRFRGIRSFLLGTDGFFLWANNSWRGNDWKSSEDTQSYGAFLFHHGDKGPVPTVRAEAFREAAEDLYLLRLAAKSNDPELKKLSSESLLNNLMKSDDPAKVQVWRDQLLTALSRVLTP